MIYFHNDYHDMCHFRVLEKMIKLHETPMPGYGEDPCCEKAATRALMCSMIAWVRRASC